MFKETIYHLILFWCNNPRNATQTHYYCGLKRSERATATWIPHVCAPIERLQFWIPIQTEQQRVRISKTFFLYVRTPPPLLCAVLLLTKSQHKKTEKEPFQFGHKIRFVGFVLVRRDGQQLLDWIEDEMETKMVFELEYNQFNYLHIILLSCCPSVDVAVIRNSMLFLGITVDLLQFFRL